MRYKLLTLLAVLAVGGCESGQKNPYETNGTFGMMDNSREPGTVVSVSMGRGVITSSNAPQPASLVPAPGFIARWFSGSGSASTNAPGSVQANVAEVNVIHYTIDKDNGKRVTINQVPEEGEPISYPGQKIMIQDNGGYLRVLPADLERRRDN